MGLQEGSCRPISAQSNSGGSAGNHRSSFFRHLHPAQSSLSNGGPTSSAYDPAFSSHSTSSPSQVFHHPLPHETYHSLHSPYPSHHLTARGTINVHAFGRHTFPPPPPTSVSHYYRSILHPVTYPKPLPLTAISSGLTESPSPSLDPAAIQTEPAGQPSDANNAPRTGGNREQRRESLGMQRLLSQNTLLQKGWLWRMSKSYQRW